MRRTPLKVDPQRVREWKDRARAAAARDGRQPLPAAIRSQIIPPGQRCIVPGCRSRARSVHHLLQVQRFPWYEHEVDNLVPLCHKHHARHESAFERLRWEWLPFRCRGWLARIARVDGDAWGALIRTYPGCRADLDGIGD